MIYRALCASDQALHALIDACPPFTCRRRIADAMHWLVHEAAYWWMRPG